MMRPLRVTYFIAYPQRMAGANRGLFDLVTNLPPDVDPTVIVVDDGPIAEAYRRAGIAVHIERPGPSLLAYGKEALTWSARRFIEVMLREGIPYARRLTRVLDALRPDLVCVNDARGALLAGPSVRILGLPLITHVRGQLAFGGVLRFAFQALPDRFILNCAALDIDLAFWARRRSLVVHDGLRPLAIEGPGDPSMERDRSRGAVTVVCLGSVVPHKGHHHLIDAVALLNERGLADRFVVVCAGAQAPEYASYQRHLDQRRAAKGVHNLRFTGWFDDPTPFYRSADIATLPSIVEERFEMDGHRMAIHGNEGIPQVHLEAMTFGLPVVATRTGGITEAVTDGVTGLLVNPGDARGLSEALGRLIEDRALRERLGAAGRAVMADHFGLRDHVRKVMDEYERMVRRAGGPGGPRWDRSSEADRTRMTAAIHA